jgi:hypothetical protein
MTNQTSTTARFAHHTLAVAVIAMIVVAGSVWAQGNGRPADTGTDRIDVAALTATIDLGNLSVLVVEQPF